MLFLRFRALTVEAGVDVGADLFISVFMFLVVDRVFFFLVGYNSSWLLLVRSVGPTTISGLYATRS